MSAFPQPHSARETFVGQGITPEEGSFAAGAMATGEPGLPRVFSWRGTKYVVSEVVEQWKEAGDCHHGSGERYVRKHWFRVRTTGGLEMKLYFERQKRPSGGSRWRLYSIRSEGDTGQRMAQAGGKGSSAC
jgi:phosphoribosylglycinamide formyltransferase-1